MARGHRRRRKAEMKTNSADVGFYVRGEDGKTHAWTTFERPDMLLRLWESEPAAEASDLPGALAEASVVLVVIPNAHKGGPQIRDVRSTIELLFEGHGD